MMFAASTAAKSVALTALEETTLPEAVNVAYRWASAVVSMMSRSSPSVVIATKPFLALA